MSNNPSCWQKNGNTIFLVHRSVGWQRRQGTSRGAHQPEADISPPSSSACMGQGMCLLPGLDQPVSTHLRADTRGAMCRNTRVYWQFQDTYIDIISIDIVWVVVSFYGLQPHPGMIICKRKKKKKQQLTRAICQAAQSPTMFSTLQRGIPHPRCFKDKRRIKYYTPTFLLLRQGRVFIILCVLQEISLTYSLIIYRCEALAEVWNFDLESCESQWNDFLISWTGSSTTSLNHMWALRFWRLPVTSTLTNDGYKPRPSLPGDVDMVLTSVIDPEFSPPALRASAGGASLSPSATWPQATQLHHQASATHLKEGWQRLPHTGLFK